MRLVALVAAGIAVIAFTPVSADATLLANYWTSAQGSGFTAHTGSSRLANLDMESDVNFTNMSDWYGTSGSFTSSIEIDTHIDACSNGGGSYTISTQHRAYDPSTGEYDFQASGASGNCSSGGGSSWNPGAGYCALNAYLVSLGYALKDPSCP